MPEHAMEETTAAAKRPARSPEPAPHAHVRTSAPAWDADGARVPGAPSAVLGIQRAAGNQAVMRMLDAQRPGHPLAGPSTVVQRISEDDELEDDDIQRAAVDLREPSDEAIRSAAAEGVRTPATTLPHLDRIQASFGRHSIGHIQAHVGTEAARASRAMNAVAYASGNHVVFGATPDLRTAAHEAAHIVQQQAGVQLSGGIGRAGDPYERHADAVADAVVAGRSSEGLLESFSRFADFHEAPTIAPGAVSRTSDAQQVEPSSSCRQKPPAPIGMPGELSLNAGTIANPERIQRLVAVVTGGTLEDITDWILLSGIEYAKQFAGGPVETFYDADFATMQARQTLCILGHGSPGLIGDEQLELNADDVVEHLLGTDHQIPDGIRIVVLSCESSQNQETNVVLPNSSLVDQIKKGLTEGGKQNIEVIGADGLSLRNPERGAPRVVIPDQKTKYIELEDREILCSKHIAAAKTFLIANLNMSVEEKAKEVARLTDPFYRKLIKKSEDASYLYPKGEGLQIL